MRLDFQVLFITCVLHFSLTSGLALAWSDDPSHKDEQLKDKDKPFQTMRGLKPGLGSEGYDFNPGDLYGSSITITGNWLFVGAPRTATSETPRTATSENCTKVGPETRCLPDGAVFVYKRGADGTVTLHQILRPPLSSEKAPNTFGVRFGTGLAAKDDRLYIVAHNDRSFHIPINKNLPQNAGQVLVYRLKASNDDACNEAEKASGDVEFLWCYHQALTSDNPTQNGVFGGTFTAPAISIDQSGNRLIVGEPRWINKNKPESSAIGAIHVFDKNPDTGNMSRTATIPIYWQDDCVGCSFQPETGHGGFSVVALGNDRYAVKSLARAKNSSTSGQVQIFSLSSLPPNNTEEGITDLEPIQTIVGATNSRTNICAELDIGGMAALLPKEESVRLAFEEPCARSGTGRISLYKEGDDGVFSKYGIRFLNADNSPFPDGPPPISSKLTDTNYPRARHSGSAQTLSFALGGEWLILNNANSISQLGAIAYDGARPSLGSFVRRNNFPWSYNRRDYSAPVLAWPLESEDENSPFLVLTAETKMEFENTGDIPFGRLRSYRYRIGKNGKPVLWPAE